MINRQKLSAALEEYKKDFDSEWQDEKYKWQAVKCFQDNWDIDAGDFAAMLAKSLEKTANLLASINNFPKKMILQYAGEEAETVRAMFLRLYDESKEVTGRILRFQSDAQELCERLSPGYVHYQRPMAITAYLWLRYPQKYEMYKYSVSKAAAEYLENPYKPVKGHTEENIKENTKMIDEIQRAVIQDTELTAMYEAKLDTECCPDKSYRMIAADVLYYIAGRLSRKEKQAQEKWIGTDYNPGISAEKWEELFENEKIFNQTSWEILYRFLDYGGMATCKQLRFNTGKQPIFITAGQRHWQKECQSI